MDKGIDGNPTSGWDTIVSIFDHKNNTFFDDPAPGQGIKQIKRLPEANFKELNLLI